jgi:hypothetical protein
LTEHSEWLSSGKVWVRYQYENAANEHTDASPLASLSVKRRSRVRVTVPEFPSGIDAVVVYAALHASAEPTLYEQVDSANKVVTLPVPLASSTAMPSGSTLAASTPATFESDDGSPLLTAKGYSRAKVRSNGQNITSASETTVDLSNLDGIDTDDYWDGASDYVVLPFTGQYEVIAQISFEANSGGKRYLKLQTDTSAPYSTWTDYAPNGDGFASAAPVAGDRATVLIDTMVDATAGTALRVRAYQNSGSTLATNCRLTVVFLGPS